MLTAPGIVLIDPKFPHNLGATIRACSCFGFESLIWTGSRIELSKCGRLPREERMKGYKSVRFINHARPFDLFGEVTPVCVDVFENSEALTTFVPPRMRCTCSDRKTARCRKSFGAYAIDSYTFRRTSV